MKALLAILLIAFPSALILKICPWWCSSIVACIVVFILQCKPGAGFFVGFAGVALAWGVIAGWIDIQNTHLLSTQVGRLLGDMSSLLLVLLTAVLGGLTGGLGGLTASVFRQWTQRRKT